MHNNNFMGSPYQCLSARLRRDAYALRYLSLRSYHSAIALIKKVQNFQKIAKYKKMKLLKKVIFKNIKIVKEVFILIFGIGSYLSSYIQI